jgi:hypothetical protein
MLLAVHVHVVLPDMVHTSSEPGRPAAFLVLLAFLGAFAFIRTSARLMRSPKVPWWPGSVETGSGLHIHHLVWGISLLLISGFVAFATDLDAPWWQITAVAFGIGAGLALDEFALWLRLADVYWSEQGRASIDAVILAAAFAGLIVVGVRPFGLDDPGSVVGTTVAVVIGLAMAGVAFFKGRLFLGVVAIFIWPVGLWCAVRLAKPTSPWARRFYKNHREGRLERSRHRFRADRPAAAWGRRLQDAIGGTPQS